VEGEGYGDGGRGLAERGVEDVACDWGFLFVCHGLSGLGWVWGRGEVRREGGEARGGWGGGHAIATCAVGRSVLGGFVDLSWRSDRVLLLLCSCGASSFVAIESSRCDVNRNVQFRANSDTNNTNENTWDIKTVYIQGLDAYHKSNPIHLSPYRPPPKPLHADHRIESNLDISVLEMDRFTCVMVHYDVLVGLV
jgi:hypothetical protein